MYTKYGLFLMTRYRDMIMTWFLQNGAWMTSRWPNDLEKVNRELEIIGPDDWQKFEGNWPMSISSKRVHKKVYGRNKKKIKKENSNEINRWSVIDRPPNNKNKERKF